MKQRIISAMVALVVLAGALIFMEYLVFDILLAFLSALLVYEILAVSKINNKIILAAALAVAFALPLIRAAYMVRYMGVLLFAYAMVILVLLLRFHKAVSYLQMGFVFFLSIALPSSISTLIYFKHTYSQTEAIFYMLLCCAGAFMSDTGGYFIGRAFGKHKLAPEISPNKTVEGVVGGIVFCAASFVLIGGIYTYVCTMLGFQITVNYPLLLIISPFASVIGIIGDLSASMVKRQCNVKDYGNIMPGHGGMMDRLDSFLVVTPFIYLVSRAVTLITLSPGP